MKNVYLVGMRGVGKTTVGKLLAEKRKASFVDLDEEIIKREEKSIPKMVKENGWDYFREKEKEALEGCLEQENIVLSTGGGVLMFFDNGEKLKENGTIVLLTAQPKTIAQRISSSQDRPSLTGKDFLSELEEVWEERKTVYSEHADVIVDTEDKNPSQIVEELLSLIED